MPRLFRTRIVRLEFLCRALDIDRLDGPQPRTAANSPQFTGATMNGSSQETKDNPYSPLLCIALLLIIAAATQFKIMSIWF
jgi:hypothetical protein